MRKIAAESPEERERILQWMTTNQHKSLTVETPEERETRLQQIRDRLAAETPEERETRLQQTRGRLADHIETVNYHSILCKLFCYNMQVLCKLFLHNMSISLVPRLSCRGGGKRLWYTLLAHAPSFLDNLHTTLLH